MADIEITSQLKQIYQQTKDQCLDEVKKKDEKNCPIIDRKLKELGISLFKRIQENFLKYPIETHSSSSTSAEKKSNELQLEVSNLEDDIKYKMDQLTELKKEVLELVEKVINNQINQQIEIDPISEQIIDKNFPYIKEFTRIQKMVENFSKEANLLADALPLRCNMIKNLREYIEEQQDSNMPLDVSNLPSQPIESIEIGQQNLNFRKKLANTSRKKPRIN